MIEPVYLGVDVGTNSARAGVFDANGRTLAVSSHPISVFRPADDYAEHSSEDIWAACGRAIRAALRDANVDASRVRALGFDATCSLVLLDENDAPVTVSPTGDPQHNVIVWMDHRAVAQAERINATKHSVLEYVGSVISPEMQPPKLLWLKENLPSSFARAARFLDLADFLVYRATSADVRSLCTTTCKWTYVGHRDGWDATFFNTIGLAELAEEGFRRIGTDVRALGERAGQVTQVAANELGIPAGTAVGVAIIDAHAGGLGVLGIQRGEETPDDEAFDHRLALICGTSSCHMAVSAAPRFIRGVWGPYQSAMVPGLWLTEGGQSATGALIDHVVFTHPRAAALDVDAKRDGKTIYDVLNERVRALAPTGTPYATLTRDVHVLPYFHGNRSPRADASLRGMISGLKLTDSVDALALSYLATIQALAYGTRHIIEAMNGNGYRIETIFACGGDAKNWLFLQEHADATGCAIVQPRESEAVLLGAAMLGAAAAGDRPSVRAAMASMNTAARTIEPAPAAVRSFHDRKYTVFRRMYDDQMAYRGIMATA